MLKFFFSYFIDFKLSSQSKKLLLLFSIEERFSQWISITYEAFIVVNTLHLRFLDFENLRMDIFLQFFFSFCSTWMSLQSNFAVRSLGSCTPRLAFRWFLLVIETCHECSRLVILHHLTKSSWSKTIYDINFIIIICCSCTIRLKLWRVSLLVSCWSSKSVWIVEESIRSKCLAHIVKLNHLIQFSSMFILKGI